MHSGTRFVWYQKLEQNRTCTIVSKFLVRDSGISNLDGELGSCAMGLRVSDLQLQNICLHSCCRFASQHVLDVTERIPDNNLCWRPTNSRWPDRLGQCWTVTGRPRWPSWNPPDVELEAIAAPVALAWCGRTVECRTPNMQPHFGQTVAGSCLILLQRYTDRADQQLSASSLVERSRWSYDVQHALNSLHHTGVMNSWLTICSCTVAVFGTSRVDKMNKPCRHAYHSISLTWQIPRPHWILCRPYPASI